MASAQDGWLCTHSYKVISDTNTSTTIQVVVYWTNNQHRYQLGHGVSAWVRCNGEEKSVVTNGGVDSWRNGTFSYTGSVELGSDTFTIPKTTSIQAISIDAKITANNSYLGSTAQTKSSDNTTVNVGALPSYKVSYNTNGAGSLSDQYKYYNIALTLHDAPKKTGYTFYRWRDSAGNQYTAKDSYTANVATTMTAQWTPNKYPVTYYSNGGNGGPWLEEKTQDQPYIISSKIIPEKANYNFKGWGTSSDSTTVRYNPGDTYSGNSALNLYAVWELAYVKPRIENLLIDREGTGVRISFNWETDKTIKEIKMEWSSVSGGSGTQSVTPVGTTEGVINELIADGQLESDSTYTLTITVRDEIDATIITKTLASDIYSIDAIYDAETNKIGIALGKAAERTGIVESALPLHVDGNIYSRNDEGVDRGVPVIYDLSEGFNPVYVSDSSQDWRCAMALCEVSATSSTTKTYAQGTLVCHNERGTSPSTVIQIAVSDNYGGYTPFITYYGTFAEGVKVAPCVFLYNGIKYGGLMFTMSEIQLTDVQFTRLNGTFEPFAVMYRDVDKGGIFNSEINSSITTEFEPTEKSIFRSNIVNKCDLLWSGNMTSTTTTISVPYNTSYSGYVLVGAFDDNSSAQKVSVYVPITSIITTQTTWGLGYASEYLDIAIRQNGTYVYVIKKAGSNGAAMITGVYGVS